LSIGVVDVGIGNIGSLKQALYRLGWDVEPVRQPGDFEGLSHVILPGVGAFRAGMEKLSGAELVGPLRAFAATGKPLMGICVGMQLLADSGEEDGHTDGLGLVPGHVRRIEGPTGLRLPHVGWNEAQQIARHPLLQGIRNDVDFYFVNSYRIALVNPGDALAETEYGERFPSIIGKANVVGAQFHPEKSQANGLRILENFCNWDGRC
jgi:imidazole glycerol-phosphate synthase subunit HisH